MWEQVFDGYCPESKLDGEKVRMRLMPTISLKAKKTGCR